MHHVIHSCHQMSYFSHPYPLMAGQDSQQSNEQIFISFSARTQNLLLFGIPRVHCGFSSLIQLNASAQNCGPTKSSILHYALLGHAYNTSVAQEYPSCMRRCMEDAQCASCNYDLVSKQCELSSSTRVTAPAKFITKVYSIYTEMLT